jgi:hypothetical protein
LGAIISGVTIVPALGVLGDAFLEGAVAEMLIPVVGFSGAVGLDGFLEELIAVLDCADVITLVRPMVPVLAPVLGCVGIILLGCVGSGKTLFGGVIPSSFPSPASARGDVVRHTPPGPLSQ